MRVMRRNDLTNKKTMTKIMTKTKTMAKTFREHHQRVIQRWWKRQRQWQWKWQPQWQIQIQCYLKKPPQRVILHTGDPWDMWWEWWGDMIDQTNQKTATKTNTMTKTNKMTNTFWEHPQGAPLETFDLGNFWSEWCCTLLPHTPVYWKESNSNKLLLYFIR